LILQRRRKFDDFLRTLLREGKADGTVRHDLNEEIAALGILTALNSMYLWWDPKRESNVDVPKQFAQLFISGVAADSGCSTR
jgi:TetR/AcrR family transcriptional regulator, cholesterol catabolism regulator